MSTALVAGLAANPLVGIEVCDAEGRLLWCNQAYSDMLGAAEDEIRRHGPTSFVYPADRDEEQTRRLSLIGGDAAPEVVQRRMVTSSGRLVWAELVSVTVGEGASRQLVSTVRDISADRRNRLLQGGRNRVLEFLYQGISQEEVCNEIAKFIEGLGEGMLVSILRLDQDKGTLHRIAAPSLPDEYSQAIEGMSIGDGVGSCGTAAYRGERVIVSDLLVHPYWKRARRLAERHGLRACWSEPIMASSGQVLGTFALYYREPREPDAGDLELIRSVAALTALVISYCRAADDLRAASQAKDDFISTAAHELRTPLAAILGFSELLTKPDAFGPFSEVERKDFQSEIHANGEVLARLVDDLLDVNKLQREVPISLELHQGSLFEAVMSVVRQFRRQYPSCSIVTPPSQDFPESLRFDRVRIVQVIQNLISNAVKYSPRCGEVAVSVHLETRKVRVAVADRGVGMTREQLARMFDKYYRADNSNTSPSGLGLGLHIARHIVEAHGGKISASSHPGEGTRVEFSLPLEPSV